MTMAMALLYNPNAKKTTQSPEPYDPKFHSRNNQPAVKQEKQS